MPTVTIPQAFDLALAHHQAGRLPEAEAIYRQILAQQPDHAGVLHMLGVLTYQKGQAEAGVALIRQAIALAPRVPEFHSNLGNILREIGLLDEAVAACRQAIALNPTLPDAYNNLGVVLVETEKWDEARAAYHQAITLKPDCAEAYHNLGIIFRHQGKLEEAIAAYRQAIALKPDYREAYHALVLIFQDRGQLQEAADLCRQAIAHRPNDPLLYNNLGFFLWSLRQFDEAIPALRHAIALKPDFAGAYNNLGNTLKDQGQLDAALVCYDHALVLEPNDTVVACNQIYLLHFHPDSSARDIYEASCRWNRKYAAPLKSSLRPHSNDSALGKKLKIGYISPDLSRHPVGRFLLPLLQNHDHARMEIFCYSDIRAPDSITNSLRESADNWRNTGHLSDQQVADLIRADGIDIMVDLTMHMAGSRLLVFARKPAPVQVTYLAYCSTTGLDAMDYRLTDPYLDPPDRKTEGMYSEQSVWLPQTYWCYLEPPTGLEVGPPPGEAVGHVTFGCLNNFSKVTDKALMVWCALLRATPNSRLLLHAGEGAHRQRTLDLLEQEGIAGERLNFAGFMSPLEYFALYREIDIGLDPFPYAGGTTTCDALWMGVPVVSLAGDIAVSRGGLSILSNVGLSELVAQTPEEYVQIATELAQDMGRLAGLRSSLRERMKSSPLMDGPGFACNVEAAYRQMWQRWCATT